MKKIKEHIEADECEEELKLAKRELTKQRSKYRPEETYKTCRKSKTIYLSGMRCNVQKMMWQRETGKNGIKNCKDIQGRNNKMMR